MYPFNDCYYAHESCFQAVTTVDSVDVTKQGDDPTATLCHSGRLYSGEEGLKEGNTKYAPAALLRRMSLPGMCCSCASFCGLSACGDQQFQHSWKLQL
jgi:hypothetical protein